MLIPIPNAAAISIRSEATGLLEPHPGRQALYDAPTEKKWPHSGLKNWFEMAAFNTEIDKPRNSADWGLRNLDQRWLRLC